MNKAIKSLLSDTPNNAFCYTIESIFVEFCKKLQLTTKEKKAGNSCLSCMNTLYTSELSNQITISSRCYRCGVLICNICSGLMLNKKHLDMHKEEGLLKGKNEAVITESLKKTEKELVQVENQINFYFQTLVNCGRFLTFAIKNQHKKTLDPLRNETLGQFTDAIIKNIGRTYKVHGSLEREIAIIAESKKTKEEQYLELCIQKLIQYMKHDMPGLDKPRSVAEFFVTNEKILTAQELQLITKDHETRKRKQTEKKCSIIPIEVLEEDSAEEELEKKKKKPKFAPMFSDCRDNDISKVIPLLEKIQRRLDQLEKKM
jgi:hypothetical protein